MRRWFSRLPIHRKLVAVALIVTTTALIVATVGLALIDLYRYRASADADAATARMLIVELQESLPVAEREGFAVRSDIRVILE